MNWNTSRIGTIYLPARLKEKMIQHTRECLPYETCGLLSGTTNRVSSIWKLESEIKHRYRYFVSKDTVDKTMKDIQSKQEQVLAIYHSHPTAPPVPSKEDILHHPEPHICMLIVSLQAKSTTWKGYTIAHGHYYHRPIVIV
ncbi:Mov34/MPN/PAD-1 family protein [Virgibacillus senegalensis]|uniref:Mov34/MPN/PAD-1 family protein n=1 Tax=Virgibacillus senegalensis TaxID=1499679 RepID=UPI00069FB911|nr:M67 family metallopeptidase [Virgibacillus senegalensis]